jgi:hypothetical protein
MKGRVRALLVEASAQGLFGDRRGRTVARRGAGDPASDA